MKKNHLILSLLLPLFFIAACSDPKPISYTSLTGGFAVVVPAPLEESELNNGDSVVHIFKLENNGYYYGVSYIEFPKETILPSNIENKFDGARDGALRNNQGKLISEEKILFDGYPGRMVVIGFNQSDSDMIMISKYFVISNRLYIILGISKSNKDNTLVIEKFINSFKLTNLKKT